MSARKGRLRKNKDSIELKKALESRKKTINKDGKKYHLIFKHS